MTHQMTGKAWMVEQFAQQGYVALPGFLDRAEVAEVRENVDRYIRAIAADLPGNMVFFEDKDRPDTIKSLQHMYQHDPFFAALFASPKVVELAETLLKGPVVGKNMQWFNKSPAKNEPTPPHQDGFYFMLKPQNALTMWLALEDVDEETGCVRYIPRSNHGRMRAHGRTGVLGFSQGIVDYGEADRAAEVAMPAGPGDLLAHHALTIHRADGNTSKNRTRQALGFIFYGANAVEDKAGHEAYHAQLFKDLAASNRI
jgi:phytanoyl-CoA hydroxylase